MKIIDKSIGPTGTKIVKEDLVKIIIEALNNPMESDEELVQVIVSGIIEAYNAGYADGHKKI